MKITIVFIITFIFGNISYVAFAKKPKVENIVNKERLEICRIQKVSRLIKVKAQEIKDFESGICITTYTKNGKERSVGSGFRWENCYKFLENIKTNLVEAGWKCKTVNMSESI